MNTATHSQTKPNTNYIREESRSYRQTYQLSKDYKYINSGPPSQTQSLSLVAAAPDSAGFPFIH